MNTEEKNKNEMPASEEPAEVTLNPETEQEGSPESEEKEAVEEKAPSTKEKIISGIKAALHEIRIGRRSIWGELFP